MNPTDLYRLQRLVESAHAVKKEFAWHDAGISRLAALLYVTEDREDDPAAMRGCLDLIKQNTGVFSSFRGNLSVALSAMLALTDDPAHKLRQTMNLYEEMKRAKFKSSDYLVVAAFEIAEGAEPARYAEVLDRTRSFYEGMKAEHRFLTSEDDYIFAALLGLSDLPVESSLRRMEQFYAELKPLLRAGNGLQALTHVLVLGGAGPYALDRLEELRELLRARKLRMDRGHTLPALGLLALLPEETRVLVDDIEEAAAYLRKQKGFGSWSLVEGELLLLASGIVVSRSVGQVREGLASPALSNALTGIAAAQQAAMIATLSATAAASTSSSSPD